MAEGADSRGCAVQYVPSPGRRRSPTVAAWLETFYERFCRESPRQTAAVPSRFKQGLLGMLGKSPTGESCGRFFFFDEMAEKIPAAVGRNRRGDGDDALRVLQKDCRVTHFRAAMAARLPCVVSPALCGVNGRHIDDVAELGL